METLQPYLPETDESRNQALEFEKCASDVAYWLNKYGKTFDPRLADPVIDFKLFPRQVELLRWIRDRELAEDDGMVEKSRDMGLTWLCAGYALHGWLFRRGFVAGFGSRKLELVDKIGDPQSIFEKIRFLLYHLPEWQVPAGFKRDVHDNFCRLIHPSSAAAITGEGGDEIGRGGRTTIYFVDEAAFLVHPQSVDGSLSQTTRCRIDVSTPNGSGNSFHTKRFSGAISVFTFHWRDDPRKNDDWYHRQKEKFDPVVVAQEIDIDYSASIEGICIPAAWVMAAVDLDLTASGDIEAGLDVAEFGRDRCVLLFGQGPVVTEIIDWGQVLTSETAYKAKDECEKRKVRTLNYDSNGVGAGVRGILDRMEEGLPFRAVGVNTGEAASSDHWPDGKTSQEKFINCRAELWWKLRERFEKAYEYKELGVSHPAEEMISIPNDRRLIADLSLPLAFRMETGKIKIESKADMRKRGIKSPDFAEALTLWIYRGQRGVQISEVPGLEIDYPHIAGADAVAWQQRIQAEHDRVMAAQDAATQEQILRMMSGR